MDENLQKDEIVLEMTPTLTLDPFGDTKLPEEKKEKPAPVEEVFKGSHSG